MRTPQARLLLGVTVVVAGMIISYLFWFGLPALLHIAGGALGVGRLNLHQTAGPSISDARPGMTLVSQGT